MTRPVTRWVDEQIIRLFRGNPKLTMKGAAFILQVTYHRVYRAVQRNGYRRRIARAIPDRRRPIGETLWPKSQS